MYKTEQLRDQARTAKERCLAVARRVILMLGAYDESPHGRSLTGEVPDDPSESAGPRAKDTHSE